MQNKAKKNIIIVVFIFIILVLLINHYSAVFTLKDAWSDSCKMAHNYGLARTTEAFCNSIPKDCAENGLIFNPKGSEAYYLRSHCFFNLAKKTNDEKYCEKVIELKVPLLDGSMYSKKNCLDNLRKKPAKHLFLPF